MNWNCKKCGKENAGYNPGGMCGNCARETENEYREEQSRKQEDVVLSRAKALAERTGITLLEAIAIVKK